MINTKLLELLESLLGESKPTSDENYAFKSPFIQSKKLKLEINLNMHSEFNLWHCWVSNKKGKTIYSLFKQMDVDASYFTRLQNIIGESSKYKYIANKISSKRPKHKFLELPKEYLYLGDNKNYNNPIAKHALFYLKRRNVNLDKICRYKIGYCPSGVYENRIIIPSYDKNCNLNYFVARNIFSDESKYLNPPCSRDVIIFELFIDWTSPIILVEGVFDSIAIENNSIPIMGKTILPKLKIELIKNEVEEVYVSLDGDAKIAAYKIAEYLSHSGINTKIVNITNQDPAELGKDKFKELLLSAKVITDEEILKYKIEVLT